MRIRKALAPFSALLTWFAGASTSIAAPASPSIVAPAAAGQQALAATTIDGAIVAKVCPGTAGCSPTGGTSMDVPADAAALIKKGARFDALKLAGGRHVVRVVADGSSGERFTMLLAAPPAGKGETPIAIWSGFTGQSKGEYGEERVNVVVEEKLDDGLRIIVGEHRNDVTMCGRPALVAARDVDPATMTLRRGASVQSLSEADRAAAVKLTAKLVTDPRPLPVVSLLRAQTASSAVGKAIGTLTDGDLETAWSEAKTGIGRGEFASMSSSSDIAISSLEFVVRPPTTDVTAGAAPKVFYLATSDKLFEVTLPEDAWRKAGARFEISFPNELSTSCLSLVLDSAFAPASADSARVTIAEVVARTSLDDRTPEALVELLSGGQPRSKAAAALLERAGKAGADAAMKGYDKLDESGQRLAEGIIDASPCSAHAPFYVRTMGEKLEARGPKRRRSDVDPSLAHATDRVRRCGRAAAPALTDLIAKAKPFVKVAAAAELALIAPAESVTVLIDELATSDDALRREMRTSLAHAAKNERARSVFATELERDRFSARTDVVKVDVLRSLGSRIPSVTGARDAFLSLWAPEAPFRTRYLLLGPAAELARSGDERALGLLTEALSKDENPHVRLRAAQVAGRVPSLRSLLIRAVDDGEVRVREAAIEALGTTDKDAEVAPPSAELTAALEGRLKKDPFTFVRVRAATSLGQLPATPASDAVLAGALRDAAPDVRARAIDGLAVHRAKNQMPALRQIADADEESAEVRSRAILALGVLCDASRVDAWTKLARLSVQGMSDGERLIGAAAIAALGDVKPKDLAKRLAPLLDPKAPRNVREAARAALETQSGCK
ncbi:MAG: HEAT repeat domain-containing protein [Polyangiaceae bacterium]|nr:HEAT repeat domain-containing protein [Polyangiaceae bacterium]